MDKGNYECLRKGSRAFFADISYNVFVGFSVKQIVRSDYDYQGAQRYTR